MELNSSNAKMEIETFNDLEIDNKILKAIEKLGWKTPTLIQKKGIKLALEGKDLLARAKTGSGKTATYSIPIINSILNSKKESDDAFFRILVLVPTKELCDQVLVQINQLTKYCKEKVKSVCVSSSVSVKIQRQQLLKSPDIIIGTPSRILSHFNKKNIEFSRLTHVVLDEADLLFSFGYEEDVRTLCSYFPSTIQSFLMLATMSKDVKNLKCLLMRNPVLLKLDESHLPPKTHLRQHVVHCSEKDKYLLLYALLALKIITGKLILFVNTINSSFKLKLFLDSFSIKACVLNSELPYNSRYLIVEKFNRGFYDIIIASDESEVLKEKDQEKKMSAQINLKKDKVIKDIDQVDLLISEETKPNIEPNERKSLKDSEYAISRGVDFQDVEWVVNVDFPTHSSAYIHRVGRTARAGKNGNSLSFVTNPKNKKVFEDIKKRLEDDETILPYQFPLKKVEKLRYRVDSILSKITRSTIKSARLNEIKTEIISSEKLKKHFDENPRELRILKYKKPFEKQTSRISLKTIPTYLQPKQEDIVDVRESLTDKNFTFNTILENKSKKTLLKPKRNITDPLKKFKIIRKQ